MPEEARTLLKSLYPLPSLAALKTEVANRVPFPEFGTEDGEARDRLVAAIGAGDDDAIEQWYYSLLDETILDSLAYFEAENRPRTPEQVIQTIAANVDRLGNPR